MYEDRLFWFSPICAFGEIIIKFPITETNDFVEKSNVSLFVKMIENSTFLKSII